MGATSFHVIINLRGSCQMIRFHNSKILVINNIFKISVNSKDNKLQVIYNYQKIYKLPGMFI